MDHEISLSGAGGRCGVTGARAAAGDFAEHGDDDLCGGNQPRSCASSDRDTAKRIGIEGGAISERKEFAQDAVGVSEPEEEILGSAFVGAGVLGSVERECYRRGVEEIY